MVKKACNIEKSCIFAFPLEGICPLMSFLIKFNKPFRRAFGSILEGRFPFYKASPKLLFDNYTQ